MRTNTKGYKISTMYSPQAVSYTHLDVYKRQILGRDSASHGTMCHVLMKTYCSKYLLHIH